MLPTLFSFVINELALDVWDTIDSRYHTNTNTLTVTLAAKTAIKLGLFTSRMYAIDPDNKISQTLK